MDIDELLFGTVSKYFKKRNKKKILLDNNAVFLKDVKPRLTILARAISGKAIEIFPAEREGGYKNNNFFLPIYFNELSTKEQNLGLYFFRILFLSVQSDLNINLIADEVFSEEKKQQILDLLFQKYPNSKEIYEELKTHFELNATPKNPADYSWIYGKLMQNDKEENTETILENFSDLVKKSNAEQIITTLQAKAVEEIITVEVDKKQQEDYVLMHSFEKVETAEEFNGNWRDFDGSDDLEKHENAIEDLNMKFTVRVDDTAHSVYQADFTENTSISESAETDTNGFHLTYNEWDFSKRRYKENYCKVYPKTQLKTDVNYYKNTISKNSSTLIGLEKF
jgi:nitric oxide reductase NorD protein